MRNSRNTVVAALALIAGIVAFLRRPVRRPEAGGRWTPRDE